MFYVENFLKFYLFIFTSKNNRAALHLTKLEHFSRDLKKKNCLFRSILHASVLSVCNLVLGPTTNGDFLLV